MRRLTCLAVLTATACGSTSTSAPPPAPSAAPLTGQTAPAPDWRNPGGMWMPRQIPGQRSVLESLGIAIDPATLADPTKPPLGAVVSLGGCSASFVSADGLIATNHHCVQGALAYNATPEDNLLENGFLAQTRADERWAGPTAHAYVVTKYDDVTREMNEGLPALPDDLARHAALEDREKKLLAGCEKGHPELRCKVEKFFGGGQWYLITQLDFRDVRLVYAPHHAVGNYGGETDNWMWPRHAGDFAFLRAYVGPDGKPAEHADKNIPYRPAYHLSIARQPLKTGDLVLVAGYPGTTKRLSTAEQTEEAASWYFPRSIGQNRDYLAALDEVIRDRPDLKIKAEPTRRGLLNYLKKNGGVLKTLTEGGLVARRQAEDRALVAWIEGDAERKARYGSALERIRVLDADKRKTREADAAFDDLVSKPKLLAQALTIVRVAEERAKPDAERDIEYQERNWTRLQQASRAMKRSYAREIDRAVLRLFLRQALALPAAEQPAFVGRLLGKSRDDKAIEAALDRLYRTKLESPEVRRELLATATLAALRKSADPFVQLALNALPEVKTREAREDAYLGGMAVAMPLYVEARAEMRKEPTAPDANGTLRITFGRVLPSPGGGRAFTTLTELAAKSTGEEPFAAPKALLAAIDKKEYRGHVSADLGEVPVDFMSDTDITNGNSGSATLDARGELVGLAFDGTLDTVASDWSYLQNVTRTIHVDVRYMLWLMDVVDHADNVLQELGRK